MFNIHKGIKEFLNGVYGHPQGQEAQRLEVLCCFINGLLKKGSCELPVIAGQMPIRTDFSSRVKQLKDWLGSAYNSWYVRYLPCLQLLLPIICEASDELIFVLDGTDLGQGCTALMVSLAYQKRGIPILWLSKKAKKGHLPQAMHLSVLQRLHTLIQSDPLLRSKKIVLLGDGEFDGGELTKACQDWGWTFVVRTAHNTLLSETPQTAIKDTYHFNKISDVAYQKGADEGHFWAIVPEVYYTEQKYGAVNAIFWHDEHYKDPLYLLSNLELAFDAYDYYKKRFAIETLFGDLKSRGFNVHKSQIEDPCLLDRLLIPLTIAYIITYATAKAENVQKIKQFIMPKHKNDLSQFQIGKRIWDLIVNQQISIILSMSMNFIILLI